MRASRSPSCCRRPPSSTALRRARALTASCGGRATPHSESTLPKSLEILERILVGVPEEERARIVGENAAELYGFDLARLAADATNRARSKPAAVAASRRARHDTQH